MQFFTLSITRQLIPILARNRLGWIFSTSGIVGLIGAITLRHISFHVALFQVVEIFTCRKSAVRGKLLGCFIKVFFDAVYGCELSHFLGG